MPPLVWALLLTVVMVALIVIELFTPSFGMLTLLSVLAFIASVYFGMQDGWSSGIAMVVANLTLIPITIFLSMHFIRQTPLSLRERIKRAHFEPEAPSPVHPWVGLEGEALTPLCPGGKARFGELRLEVTAGSKYLERGTRVRVISVEGSIAHVEAF